jgi:dUTP pyrophosphatase
MFPTINYIQIKLINGASDVWHKGSVGAAGFDIQSNEAVILEPNERVAISTGVCLSIHEGYFGHIMPRSGLAFKYGIDILAGVIDSDYRGEIKVILINHGKESFGVKRGDRIAQIVFMKCENLFEFKVVDTLETSIRQFGCFGSTGFGQTSGFGNSNNRLFGSNNGFSSGNRLFEFNSKTFGNNQEGETSGGSFFNPINSCINDQSFGGKYNYHVVPWADPIIDDINNLNNNNNMSDDDFPTRTPLVRSETISTVPEFIQK